MLFLFRHIITPLIISPIRIKPPTTPTTTGIVGEEWCLDGAEIADTVDEGTVDEGTVDEGTVDEDGDAVGVVIAICA